MLELLWAANISVDTAGFAFSCLGWLLQTWREKNCRTFFLLSFFVWVLIYYDTKLELGGGPTYKTTFIAFNTYNRNACAHARCGIHLIWLVHAPSQNTLKAPQCRFLAPQIEACFRTAFLNCGLLIHLN